MRTIAEYEVWLAGQHDPVLLRAEALERMRVNVGLLAENEELKRRVRQLEGGTTTAPPERGGGRIGSGQGRRSQQEGV